MNKYKYAIPLVACLALAACDSTGTGADVPTAETSFFDTYTSQSFDVTNPMVPTSSFAPENARLGDGSVSVVDGRLQFQDIDAYVAFIQEAMEWTVEDRAEFESSTGFVSLASYVDSLQANPDNVRLSERPLYVADPTMESMLDPSSTIGIGDRVYVLSQDRITAYTPDGGYVGDAPVSMTPPPCDEATVFECPGGGTGGGGGTGNPSETPAVDIQYGPVLHNQETRDLQQFELEAEIFRFHIFIYSSLGASSGNGVLDHNFLEQYHFDAYAPDSGAINCTATYGARSDDYIRVYYNGFPNPGSTQQASSHELKGYLDIDVFDTTGTESLQRMECTHTATSRLHYGNGQPSGPPYSGSASTSKNF